MPLTPLHFNKTLDLKLLELVKTNPCLYDASSPNHSDLDTREVTWQKIGDALNRPAKLCKQRWVNIRDMMRRKLRERSRNPNAHQVCYQYRYEENLQFMIPHFRETPSIANATRDFNVFDQNCSMDDFTENVEFITDTDDKTTPNRSFKRLKEDSFDTYTDKEYDSTNDTHSESKKEFVLSKTTDPLEVFLMSIGSTLRKFSPYYLNHAKSKIFQIVQDYELEQICNGKDGHCSNSYNNASS